MTPQVDIHPALLDWACERSGKPIASLQHRFPALESWRNTTKRPTLKQLEAFARATHTALGAFFLPTPPDDALPIPDLRTVGSDHRPRPSVDLLATIQGCQQRQAWFQEYARAEQLEPIAFIGSARLTNAPAQIAANIRDALGLGSPNQPVASANAAQLRNLIDAIEKLGVLVMISGIVETDTHRPLDVAEFRGFALVDTLAPLIFVNGRDSKAAQMFTLAHELGHLWLGQGGVSDLPIGRHPVSPVERWCNAVAAEVLVPLASLDEAYQSDADLDAEISRLAQRFGVSTLVIIRRLGDLDALDSGEMWALYQREAARLASLAHPGAGGGNFVLTQRARLGWRFTAALASSALAGHTLYRDAYRLSGCRKPSSFEALAHSVGVR